MQNSCVSLFSYLPTPCGGTRVTLPEKSMPCPGGVSGAPWLFSLEILKLGNGTYLHDPERRSALRLGLQNTPVCGRVSPLVFVSGQWDNPTVETRVLCHIITYGGKRQANSSACWASEGEKRICYLLTPEGSRSLQNVDVGITLGFWG